MKKFSRKLLKQVLKMGNDKKTGVILILIAGFFWALETIFVRLSLKNSTPAETATIAVMAASVVALSYIFLTKKKIRFNKPEFYGLLYNGIIGISLAMLLYYASLSKTSILNAVLIAHAQPIFIIILAYIFLREKMSKFDWFGGIIILISAIFVTSRSWDNLISLKFGNIGDLLAVIVTLLWASAAVVAKKYLMKLDSSVIAFYRFFFGFIPLGVYLLFINEFSINSAYQIILGVVIGLGTIFYYEGLKRIKTAQVGFLELSSPLYASIFAFFLFGEAVTSLQLLGIALLFIGVYLLSKKEN